MKAYVAGCVIEKDGKYLMVKEKKRDHYGEYNLPSGAVEEGETIQDAAIREVEEETGYEVELLGVLPIQTILRDNQTVIKVMFQARITGGSLKNIDDQESLGVEWLSKEELKSLGKDNIRSDTSVFMAIKKLEEGKIYPMELLNECIIHERGKGSLFGLGK